MLLQVFAVASLFFLPAAFADTITTTVTDLYTNAYCYSSGQVSGVYTDTGGSQMCACIKDNGGSGICGGTTPACALTQTSYESGVVSMQAGCTTCDADTCVNYYLATWVDYGTSCYPGEVLYIFDDFGRQACGGCDTPEDISTIYGAVACPAVDNSYTTCIGTQTILSDQNQGWGATCSFICEPNYHTSQDGTHCVPDPVASSITQIISTLYTTAHCIQSNQFSGIYSEDGVEVCGCVSEDEATDICVDVTSACLSTETDYFGQPSTYTASCTTCDVDTCQNSVQTTVQYDSECESGTVLYIAGTATSPFCVGCDTPDNIAYYGQVACAPVENSYATCTTSVTTYDQSIYGADQSLAASCSFVCVTGYQSSVDGTSCVLSATPTPTGLGVSDRRKWRELIKRRKANMIF